MILVEFKDNYYRAVFICDQCEQRIQDAGLAVALVTTKHDPDADLFNVLHIHKIDCLERAQAAQGYNTQSHELGLHIHMLIKNSGLNLSKLEMWKDFQG